MECNGIATVLGKTIEKKHRFNNRFMSVNHKKNFVFYVYYTYFMCLTNRIKMI